MVRVKEVELDHAFAEAIERSADFRSWLLRGGRFARHCESSRLLLDEQKAARGKAKHFWKHWWCKLPDGSESETDLFLVFEADGERFALHIENKPPDGPLRLRQAADYRRRAAFKANDEAWLNYADFETMLLAPSAFIERNVECARQFDRTLTYESVAEFAPLFGEALS